MTTIALESFGAPAHLHGIEVSVSYVPASATHDFRPPMPSGAYKLEIKADFGTTRSMFSFFENIEDGESWMMQELEHTFHLDGLWPEMVVSSLTEHIHEMQAADDEIMRYAR